ncbi:MAG TPA: Uma2 family endonuclease [Nitrospira sp.]|nr:Uma2 family endonuclease [Nitrospira sp.]
MATPAVQTKRWTRQEYDHIAEAGLFNPDERVELLEGEIITVTPQQSRHSVCIGLIDGALRQVFGASYWIRIQLPLIIDPDSEPEPDLAVVLGSPRDYVHDHPRTAILVVEVADSTIAKDRTYKSRIYARAGIQEYWIVNLAECCLEVYRDPAAAPGQTSLYRSSQKLAPSDSIAPLAASTTPVAVADLLP